MQRRQFDPSQPAETDERFPSGPWTGFWLQQPLTGRQWMRDLWLHFLDGQVQGGGCDWVGEFGFSGQYDLSNGRCTLIKSYVGLHDVAYEGQNENDGKWLWGVWKIAPGVDHGGFHMWPKGESDPTQQRLAEEAHLPVEQDVAVGV